ncbi:MAG: sulfite exporter TauE/SafE family protein, partial [Bifidobacteriaceae bacterium]|nr:sulfite exporter TauE/SafE family protein [Bifidobacteriaceae bacterium]
MPPHLSDPPRGPGRLWRFVLAGAIGGLTSGLFGVGGGIVMAPLLIWLGGLDQRRASAASLAAIIPTAIVGASLYGLRGQVVLGPALIVAAGGTAGAWLGARALR